MASPDRIRIEVTRAGRWWCEIIAAGDNAEAVVADLAGRLPAEDGYVAKVIREREASRIVEVGDGTRVLGRTYKAI